MSNPRGRAARTRCIIFFSKIFEIPRVNAVRAWCASSLFINSTVLNLIMLSLVHAVQPDASYLHVHVQLYMYVNLYVLDVLNLVSADTSIRIRDFFF